LELEREYNVAEENKTNLSNDSQKQEEVDKELKIKSDKLKKLNENKKLFDKKESLLKDKKRIDKDIEQADEMIETLEAEKKLPLPKKPNKISAIIFIIIGALLSLTLYGAIVGVPLIIYGIYKLIKKSKEIPIVENNVSSNVAKYKKQKKDLINDRAVVESKLEKYKLVNFSLDDFQDLEKLVEEVEELKSKNIELKTSISTTKQLVKSPEEIYEDLEIFGNQIDDLTEKSEEHSLAFKYLELAGHEVQQKFTPSIEKDSKFILKKVTNNKYSDLKINEENLDISIKVPEINEFVPVDVLSQGAKDQIYFAIRTTMTDLLSGDINVPLIFDDPFHNFDDIRLKKTISIVKELSKCKQIILISHKPYQKDFKDFADNIIEV